MRDKSMKRTFHEDLEMCTYTLQRRQKLTDIQKSKSYRNKILLEGIEKQRTTKCFCLTKFFYR